ncbi:MAG: hypothetical protein JWO18_746 [Microbacteriaceae bacterium]|nr:hypothetical protein [Microbacteriaceae bacterium]
MALVLGVTVLPSLASPQKAEAAVGSQFNPGMILSDALFYDGGAMSIGTVQNFLDSQVRTCRAGYTCLKDYRQDTPNKAAVAGRCAAYQGLANESAAQIIARVGAACGISQKALLVLLEKEQGLVSSTAPSATKYKIATGYGCPDTAACDTTYYGFFNQIWMASLQFKIYLTSPSSFNIRAGRVNQVRFSPNAACGSSAVFVQNAATAGLYNYTPYQPNAAALANLYGTGDGCSSYGNRNFWRTFSDWFGATTASSMLRTTTDPTVYLVVGTEKYPVTSFAIYSAFSPLGPASMVSQTYLDTLTTGRTLGRIVRGPDGAIYFVDSAIKLQFTSCNQVVDYGGSCNADGYVNLTDAQIAAFHTGPYVTPVLGTQEGPRYLLSAGVKHEVLDNASQSAAGLVPGFNVLTEAALADLPYGTPIVRDDVFVGQSGSSSYFLMEGGKKYAISGEDATAMGAASRAAGSMHAESLALMPSGTSGFVGAVTAPGSTIVQLLTGRGRSALSITGLAAALTPLPVGQNLMDLYPDAGPIAPGAFVKAPTDPTVYVMTQSALRQVGGWDALVSLGGTANPTILTLPSGVIAAMPKGQMALAPGTMYRSVDNAQIYLIDGLGDKIPVRNFDYTTAAGFTVWKYATAANLDPYPVNSGSLTYGTQCGTTKYVSVGGLLRPVSSTMQALFPFSYLQLDPLTCSQTVVGAPAIDFIRTADGAIYQLSGGQKHHVGAATFSQLNGGKGWMPVPDSFASLIPTGANV